jgi:NAD(P)-dependent dehydrogenase (short-subunit alcohol dehydrogenase family)
VVNDLGTSLQGEGENAGPARQVVDEILAHGGRAVASTDSVASPTGAARLIATAIGHFGRIDGVVNNAGIIRDKMFHKMSEGDWDAVLRVHLYGSYYVSREAANHFREQQSGAYVHMTSGAGLIGNLGQANYSAAKMGIVALSRSIALDLRRYGVRSNCIAPVAWSRMLASIPAATPEQRALADKRERIMKVEKIAPLAVYLLSDAARETSGQVFGVRGNEIIVYSQPRPIRSVHRSDGWTPEQIAEYAIPGLKSSFCALETTVDVFSGEPM